MLPSHCRSAVRALHVLFASWRFPAFALALLSFYNLLVLLMLAAPITNDAFGRFAEEFKIWCFGYDPATGEMQTMYVVLMVTEPIALGSIFALVWWKQIREALQAPRQLVPWVASAFTVVMLGAVAITTLGGRTVVEGELPFPAERLRLSHVPADFQLVDHEGQPIQLAALRGKVVVVTGIYATCNFTCPMLLGQAKRAVAALPDAAAKEIAIVGITLDPERDTPERLAEMAEAQGVAAPLFRLATGEPAYVNQVLDNFDVSRRRVPDTSVIDHANLFLVIDREGRLAYRLTLGERQEEWLISALRLLVAEGGGRVG